MPRPESCHSDFRLLPAVLDWKAANDPDGIYASLPKSNDLSDGFRDYTNSEVVCAVDAFAWWLVGAFGRSERFETMSYVGINDLRYVVFFQACVKAGYKALFFSPRNTAQQNAALIKQTQCRTLFFSEEYKDLAESLSQEEDLEKLCSVALDPIDLWIEKADAPYPYEKSHEEACLDPIVVFHSSGSTGPPKTITQNHQFFINGHRFPPLPDEKRGNFYDLYKFEAQGYTTATFPFYHLAGFTALCLNPLFYPNCSMVYGFPDRPANAETILQILKLKPVRVINTPPSIVEGILQLPNAETCLQNLDAIIYAGGPLAGWAGDKLSQHVNLVANYGSTESGPVTLLLPERHNWAWFDFHPAINLRWDPVFDDVHELVLEKDGEADRYQPISATILRSQSSFHTKDLFVPHPTQKGLWRFFGRNDDIVVFSNGLKWNPLPSEATVKSHPDVAGVLMIGTGLLQPIAVIERTDSARHKTDSDIIQSIWPTVKRANQETQRYGRVNRSRILCVGPSTFLRTPKGSVIRQATVRLLQQQLGDPSRWPFVNGNRLPSNRGISSREDLAELVRICTLDELSLEELDDDKDFFAMGLDSLGAIEVSTGIRQMLHPTWATDKTSFIQAQTIFSHPSVNRLSHILDHVLLRAQEPSAFKAGSEKDLITRYQISGDLRQAAATSDLNRLSVAITGSTGSLGSCLVERLAHTASTATILCLNRGDDTGVQMKKLLPSLSPDLWAKITFRRFDTHKTNLGLDDETVELLQQCDAVIHCAWPVNFLQSVDSFEDQIRGVQQLGQLSLRSPQYQRLLFISSVSAVSSLKNSKVKEDVYHDTDFAAPTGYGQSKQISERLLSEVVQRASLPVSILRIGQIAGHDPSFQTDPFTQSAALPKWNMNEWFPSMVKTAQSLGKIPQEFSDINWIPVNVLSQIITDIVARDVQHGQFKVYNLVNPHRTPWSAIFGPINASLEEPAEVISLRDWVKLLQEKDANSLRDIERYPALKLLRFITERSHDRDEQRVEYSVLNGLDASPTMAALQPISEDAIHFWITQWAKSGENH